ncbi:hypothetical protein I7I51_08395 [Histoplasma capsulatum]|uniref:Uncharacterized protein n=1 Tax=Ajellomyces capsulatus TaxID=5037 RepID=A0A8A1M090_AJECA|nr:hypothetical protein I7I51_08395 [Histoplasma capsulatum]
MPVTYTGTSPMLRGADEPVRLRGSPPRKEDLSMPLLPLLPLQLHQSNSSSIGLPKHNTTIGIFPLASALVASGGTSGLERLPDGQPDQAAILIALLLRQSAVVDKSIQLQMTTTINLLLKSLVEISTETSPVLRGAGGPLRPLGGPPTYAMKMLLKALGLVEYLGSTRYISNGGDTPSMTREKYGKSDIQNGHRPGNSLKEHVEDFLSAHEERNACEAKSRMKFSLSPEPIGQLVDGTMTTRLSIAKGQHNHLLNGCDHSHISTRGCGGMARTTAGPNTTYTLRPLVAA